MQAMTRRTRRLTSILAGLLCALAGLAGGANADSGTVTVDPAGGFMPSARFTVTHDCPQSNSKCIWFWEASMYVAPTSCPTKFDDHHLTWVEPRLHTGSGTATETTPLVAPKLESMVVVVCVYVSDESTVLVGQSPPITLTLETGHPSSGNKQGITLHNADEWAYSAIAEYFYHNHVPPRVGRTVRITRCAPAGSRRFRCQIAWRDRNYTYSGSAVVGDYNARTEEDRYSLRVTRRDVRNRHKTLIVVPY
jgi:hypothetical protein